MPSSPVGEGDTVLVDVDEEENVQLSRVDSDDNGEAEENEEEAVPTV